MFAYAIAHASWEACRAQADFGVKMIGYAALTKPTRLWFSGPLPSSHPLLHRLHCLVGSLLGGGKCFLGCIPGDFGRMLDRFFTGASRFFD